MTAVYKISSENQKPENCAGSSIKKTFTQGFGKIDSPMSSWGPRRIMCRSSSCASEVTVNVVDATGGVMLLCGMCCISSFCVIYFLYFCVVFRNRARSRRRRCWIVTTQTILPNISSPTLPSFTTARHVTVVFGCCGAVLSIMHLGIV